MTMDDLDLDQPLDKRKRTRSTKPRSTKKSAVLDIPGMREQFVFHYVRLAMLGKPNGSEAARLAGYSEKTAGSQAHDLLKEPEIKEAIVRLGAKVASEIDYDGTTILRELASIAFAPITPGYVRASDKKAALELLGVNLKLWEGSRGDRIINFNILQLDEKTL